MDKQKAKEALDKLFGDMAGAMTAGMVYLGIQTGLFRILKEPMTSAVVARTAGLQPRYVEEWLKGMTSAGVLAYDPAKEAFSLPEEYAYFLASEGTDHFVGGLFAMVPPLLRVAPEVAEAFRRGGGVAFADFGPGCVEALDLINRGQYESRLADYWLKAMPDVAAKLAAGGRALDVGCGSGAVCAALNKAYPKSEVVGMDPDQESIRRAQETAPRAKFVTQMPKGQSFDLITLCDVLHDLAQPVQTLKEIRALLARDGALFIVEPKAADRLEENRDAVSTTFYGFSLFHCMTQSLARGGPGLGTCLGPAATSKLLHDAGFSRVEQLNLKSLTNLFYAARV